MAQNSIIELQVINYVVKNGDLSMLKSENITPQQFSATYRDVISYVFEHDRKYGNVPDEGTLLNHFGDDYVVLEVRESPTYLKTKLKEYLAYVKLANDFGPIREKLDSGDVQGALSDLRASVEDGMKTFGVTSSVGTDLTKVLSRLDDYEKRLSGEVDTRTYSLGLDGLDDAFGGIVNDDVVLVFARTSHGKSYLLTYMAHALYRQGLNVLMYSGEMNSKDVGYRFDSIDSHFSNKALMFGKHLEGSKSFAQYQRYAEELKTGTNFFKVVTPQDLGGRMINIPDLEIFLDTQKPDVLVLDQLSLMADVRSNKVTQERTRYSNIMADLRILSTKYNVPILIAAQANRQSATRDEDGEFEIPEVSHVAESDAIVHHCTRAIGFCTNRIDDGSVKVMSIGIKKNRFGGEASFKVNVDFEHGTFEEVKHLRLKDTMESEGAF